MDKDRIAGSAKEIKRLAGNGLMYLAAVVTRIWSLKWTEPQCRSKLGHKPGRPSFFHGRPKAI